MKHTYTKEQLQTSINAACKETHNKFLHAIGCNIIIDPDLLPTQWLAEQPARLNLIEVALAALPEPETPTVDGNAETPWIEWQGGECPLNDDAQEVEWMLRDSTTHKAHANRFLALEWKHGGGPFDIIAYRVLRWREDGETVDWKERYEQMHSQAKHHLQLLSDWQTRAEKAEAELANTLQAIGLMTTCAPKVVMNPNNLLGMAQEVCDYVATLGFSRLHPISEAGPVPKGCVRVTGERHKDGEWILGTCLAKWDTHFADIQIPADPYAELKKAENEGKTIQSEQHHEKSGKWLDCSPNWTLPPERYRIKPEPETFEAHGKIWTRHTPGDAMPCDGGALVELIEEREITGRYSKYVDHAATFVWSAAIGWRYADEPTPEPLEPAPWTPKVGEVVMLKSGSPDMTVRCFTPEGAALCDWFKPGGERDSATLPITSLQPA